MCSLRSSDRRTQAAFGWGSSPWEPSGNKDAAVPSLPVLLFLNPRPGPHVCPGPGSSHTVTTDEKVKVCFLPPVVNNQLLGIGDLKDQVVIPASPRKTAPPHPDKQTHRPLRWAPLWWCYWQIRWRCCWSERWCSCGCRGWRVGGSAHSSVGSQCWDWGLRRSSSLLSPTGSDQTGSL